MEFLFILFNKYFLNLLHSFIHCQTIICLSSLTLINKFLFKTDIDVTELLCFSNSKSYLYFHNLIIYTEF